MFLAWLRLTVRFFFWSILVLIILVALYYGYLFLNELAMTYWMESVTKTKMFLVRYKHLLGGESFTAEQIAWFEKKTDFRIKSEWFRGITNPEVFESAIWKCYLNAYGGQNILFTVPEVWQMTLAKPTNLLQYTGENFYLSRVDVIANHVIPTFLNNTPFTIFVKGIVVQLAGDFAATFPDNNVFIYKNIIIEYDINPYEIMVYGVIIGAIIVVPGLFLLYVQITGNFPFF